MILVLPIDSLPDVPVWNGVMDSEGRGYPAAAFKLLRVQPKCLICSKLETAFWLSTSIFTLTNVTYLVRTNTGQKSS